MKIIIAGSRNMVPIKEDWVLLDRLLIEMSITEIVSGCAKGADTFGEEWADDQRLPVKKFPADWDKYGKNAGPIRNKQMAEYADGLVAFRFKNSKGTTNMIKQARECELEVVVIDKS